jgi:hypothetical protein
MPHVPTALALNALGEGVCPATAQVGEQVIVIGGVLMGTPLHTMLGLEQFGEIPP